MSVERRCWQVETSRGPVTAVVAGRLYKDDVGPSPGGGQPVVGDWVRLEPGRDRHRIVELLPRASWLTRRVVGRDRRDRGRSQVLCANVDRMFAVTAAGTDFSPRRVERFVTLAREGKCDPVVVLNKADQAEDLDARLAALRAAAPGAPVLSTVATRSDGWQALEPYLEPKTTVAFIGASGVGKSTLVNRVLGDAAQRTGEVRATDQKGRHTTTQRHLFVAPSGVLVIDNPGVREVGILEEGLAEAFPDIGELAAGCRFRDCQHRHEPGCAVRAAVDAGRLPAERLQSFLRLQEQA